MKVLLAPNSFKECANSVELAGYFAGALMRHDKTGELEIIIRPITDGGDGFLEVCKSYFDLELFHFTVSLPFGDGKFQVPVGYYKAGKTVFIESAEVLGLKIIPVGKRHPLQLSSKGLGELIAAISEAAGKGLEVVKVIIGIGGTGTSDLGIGMCAALGLKLLDEKGNELLPIPENFCRVRQIIPVSNPLGFSILTITDVQNPLLGPLGSNMVFAHQKGASPEETEMLEAGFENIIFAISRDGQFIEKDKLSGAGGGLAAACKLLLNAQSETAADFITNDLGINSHLINPDAIITGEGKLDHQSFMQKGIHVILNEFSGKNIPVFICTGRAELPQENKLPDNIHIIEFTKYFGTKEESIREIRLAVDKSSREIILYLQSQN